MLLILMSVLIFAAVSMAAFAFYTTSVTDRSPVAMRLRELRMLHANTSSVAYGRRPSALVRLIAQLGGFLPANEGSDAMRTGLVRAGFRRADAPLIFMGSKVLCAATFPVLWMTFGAFTGRPVGNVMLLSVLLAFVGFYMPTFYIAMRQRARHGEILSSLPDALDLMVVCVSPDLDADALRNLAERTGVEDVYSLVAMLIQTDRLGTSVAQSLRAHAESMRTRRRQRAEQMARKASIKLAFPLVFMIFPALLVIILGPAGIQLLKALSADR